MKRYMAVIAVMVRGSNLSLARHKLSPQKNRWLDPRTRCSVARRGLQMVGAPRFRSAASTARETLVFRSYARGPSGLQSFFSHETRKRT